MSVPAPGAIIFDWDNTLVETWPVIHAALHETFVTMEVEPWTFEETKARVRHSMQESFPKLFQDRWETARDVFYGAYEKAHLEHLEPCEGAGELLATLDGYGVPLCVVSNKTGRYLRLEAAHLGWSGYFGQLVGAGDAARDKPAAARAKDAAAVQRKMDARRDRLAYRCGGGGRCKKQERIATADR